MATATRDPLRLVWSDSDSGGQIVVTPADKDRYVIKVNRAIEMLQQARHAEEFKSQFHLLLRLLAGWLRDKKEVGRAFVTLRDGAMIFVVVRESCEYSDDFEDALSDLDYDIANDKDLDHITLNAIALPPTSEEALSSFLSPEFVLEYSQHGDRGRPHSTGE